MEEDKTIKNESKIHYVIYEDKGLYQFHLDYYTKKPEPKIYFHSSINRYLNNEQFETYDEALKEYNYRCQQLNMIPHPNPELVKSKLGSGYLFFIVLISDVLAKPYILYKNTASKKSIRFMERLVGGEINAVLNIKKQDKMTICEKNIFNIVLRSKEKITLKYVDFKFVTNHKLLDAPLVKDFLF